MSSFQIFKERNSGMADGTPDFTDLLAAFDDQPSMHPHGGSASSRIGMQHGHPQFGAFGNLQLNSQIGADQHHSQVGPNQAVYALPSQLQQISVQRPAPSISQRNATQSQNISAQSINPSTDEDQSFSGGSLGSMFLSSVESLLSDEGTTPYMIKINQPQAQARATQRRPRPKQKQAVPPKVQVTRGLQNNNANSSVSVASFNKTDGNYGQQQFGAAPNPAVAPNNTSADTTTVQPSVPFAIPPEIQMNMASGAGQQKVYQQTQFTHPTKGARQQIHQPLGPNSPRPLSATSSTSDHTSRPGSVPQPSPSCGSNHSGDPATPLTPQSYNAGQNYNAATPGQPMTPNQHNVVSHVSPQMPSQLNQITNEHMLPNQDSRFPAPLSSVKTHNKSSDSLADLPTPIKEAILPDGIGGQSDFHVQNPAADQTINLGDSMWMPNMGPSVVGYPGQNAQDSILPGNVKPFMIPTQSSMNSNFQPFNAFIIPQSVFDQSNENFPTTEVLTQSQSKLLEQMASLGKNKRKNVEPITTPCTTITASYPTPTAFSASGSASQSDRSVTMEMMDKASSAGAATVKELFNPPNACYEAISPVSDIAVSPVSKTNLLDDTSENSLFSINKFQLSKSDQADHSSGTRGNAAMTDPVLMYLKHDNMTHQTSATTSAISAAFTSTSSLNNPLLLPQNTSQNIPLGPSNISTPFMSQNSGISSTLGIEVNDNTKTSAMKTKQTLRTEASGSALSETSFSTWDNSVTSKPWRPLPTVNISGSNSVSESLVNSSQFDGIRAQMSFSTSSVTTDGSPAMMKDKNSNSVSKSPKSGFGVSRRRSSVEKSKGNAKFNKAHSLDNDFGFGSDEPTIRLANKHPNTSSVKSINSGPKQPGKSESHILSPKSRTASSQQPMGDDVKDAMEDLKRLHQQKEMLLKIQQFQAQQKVSAVAAKTKQSSPLARGSSATLHYQLPTLNNPVIPTSQPVKTLEENSFKPVLVSSTSNASDSHESLFQNKMAISMNPMRNLSAMPTGAMPVTVSLQSQTNKVSHQPPAPMITNQNVLQFDPEISISNPLTSFQPHKTSSSSFASSIQPHPAVSISHAASAPYNFSSFFTPTTKTQPVITSSPMMPAMSFPNFHPSKKSSSSSSVTHPYDLDWLHREPDNPFFMQDKEKKFLPPVTSVHEMTLPKPLSLVPPPMVTSAKAETTSALPYFSKADVLLSPSKGLKQVIHTVAPDAIPNSRMMQTKVPVCVAATSSTSSLKDVAPIPHETKQHYGKKHRILEGSYPGLSDSYKGTNTTSVVNNITTAPVSSSNPSTFDTLACSVLDKQRRYSKDRKNLKPPSKVLNPNQDLPTISEITLSSSAAVSQRNTISQGSTVTMTTPASLSSRSSIPTTTNTAIDLRTSTATTQLASSNKPKDTTQTGNMLSLFNSLLQEASKSAADSLKTNLTNQPSQEKKDETNKIKANSTVPASASSKNLDKKPLTVSNVNKLPVPVSANAAATVQSRATPAPEIKPVKQIRPAATVPFKRRPYPAIEDFETPKILPKSVPIVSAPTTTTASITALAAATKTTISNMPLSVSSKSEKSMSSSASVIPPVSLSSTVAVTVSTSVTVSTLSNDTKTTSSCSSPAQKQILGKVSALPKLRITAFRSSAGQVIHQASMVNQDSQRESLSKQSKKKKKKKKRKRHISSSDYDSSVSSMNSLSSFEPIVPKVTPAQGKVEQSVEDMVQEPIKAIKASEMDNKKPLKKQKRSIAASGGDAKKKKGASAKRIKLTKESKQKGESKKKEQVARYQPKSAFQSNCNTTTSTTSTKISVPLPNTFQRAPGKLPLYMNTSESKSGTVPTIQLVARNTRLLETSVATKTTTSPKIVSVKLSNSLSTKTFPPQILSSTGLQYIVPNSRSQPRIILPNNISSSVTVPVSVVSSLVNRTTATTMLLPVPIGPQTTTSPVANKPPVIVIQQSTPGNVTNSSVVFAPLKSPIFSISSTKSQESTKVTSSTSLITTMTSLPTVVTSKIVLPAVSSLSDANSFQSTFSKLISNQNPIPVYTPPATPTCLRMEVENKKYHQCLECRDTFMFQSSLEDHYERRSILIKVRCMQCNQNLIFLNKCKLLMHARQHSDNGSGMQFNNAHISPLPITMCKPRSKESFLSSSSTSSRRRSTVSSEDERSHLSQTYGHDLTTTCTDCNFVAGSPEGLEEHFQQQMVSDSSEASTSSKQKSSNFTCDMCNLTLCNQCSFNAHMRMHKKVAPHTCPECGQTFDFDGKEMDFNLHLSIQCFHLSRMSCYKCRLCSSIFKNGDLLRRHLEVRHLQTFYKCGDCPMAFKTQLNIRNHQRTSHRVATATKTIHKCPLCDTVFTDNSPTQQLFLLQKHFEGHINHPSINITAYKCLFCSHIYERKSLLRDHLKTVHDVTSPGDSGSDLTQEINEAGLLLDIQTNAAEVTPVKKTGKKRPAVEMSSAREISAKVANVVSSAPKKADDISANAHIACGTLPNIDSSKKLSGGGNHLSNKLLGIGSSSVSHTRQPLKLRLKGMKPHLPSNLSSKFQSGRSPENLEDVGAKSDANSGYVGSSMPCVTGEDGKKVYPCNECDKEFPSSNSRLNHIRSKHRGIRTVYCCPHCPVDKIKFAKRITLVKHLKKVHKMVEITKQDIKTVSAHIPTIAAGQRFDASSITIEENEKGGVEGRSALDFRVTNGSGDSHKHVRKKITALGRKTNGSRAEPFRQARIRAENRRSSLDMSSSEDEKSEKSVDNEIGDEAAFAALRFPDVYTCAKCEYQSNDRLVFQAHIVEHREDDELQSFNLGSMQQCTECGLCFASVASHDKHLFIKHKIKKRRLYERYDEKLRTQRAAEGRQLASEEGGASVSGSDASKKHKCSVCFRRFDDEGQLRTHMRTHGLAFVKSKHVS